MLHSAWTWDLSLPGWVYSLPIWRGCVFLTHPTAFSFTLAPSGLTFNHSVSLYTSQLSSSVYFGQLSLLVVAAQFKKVYLQVSSVLWWCVGKPNVSLCLRLCLAHGAWCPSLAPHMCNISLTLSIKLKHTHTLSKQTNHNSPSLHRS